MSLLLSKASNMKTTVKDELDDSYEDPVFLDDDDEGNGEQATAGSQALGGLVLLQCFTGSTFGQECVVSQSNLDLISRVCQLAASDDEALRSGSLQVIGGWIHSKHKGYPSGPIANALKANHDVICLCLNSIDHASLSVRRNAAQLLSVIEPNEEVEARLERLVSTVRQSLLSEAPDLPSPYPMAFLSLPTASSSETSSKRRLVLGFIEVVRALAQADPPTPHPLFKPCINTLVDIFICSWNIPLVTDAPHANYWLHDHQFKESALDALIEILRTNAWAQAADQCFAILCTLILALLGKPESIGHTRAALALLGAINLPLGQIHSSMLAQVSVLLDLVADIFDAAWHSEHREDEGPLKAKDLPIPARLDDEGINIFSAVNQVSLLSLPPMDQAGLHFEFSSKKPVMHVESGLGYRILLQVLQAWRQIFSRCSASQTLLDRLEVTKWRDCVDFATKHTRHQVSSAALDLKALIDPKAKKGKENVDADLQAAFSDAEEGPEIIDLKPLITDEELNQVLSGSQDDPDPDMVDFLRSFLDASLNINGAEGAKEHPDGMFEGWSDARVEKEEAHQVRKALDLLPDPRDTNKLCIKYDTLFGAS